MSFVNHERARGQVQVFADHCAWTLIDGKTWGQKRGKKEARTLNTASDFELRSLTSKSSDNLRRHPRSCDLVLAGRRGSCKFVLQLGGANSNSIETARGGNQQAGYLPQVVESKQLQARGGSHEIDAKVALKKEGCQSWDWVPPTSISSSAQCVHCKVGCPRI